MFHDVKPGKLENNGSKGILLGLAADSCGRYYKIYNLQTGGVIKNRFFLPLCEHNKDYDGENNPNVSDALDFKDKESDTSSDSETDNGVNGHKNRASPLQKESPSINQRVQVEFFKNGNRKAFSGGIIGIKETIMSLDLMTAKSSTT
jgi:hypothetical protein